MKKEICTKCDLGSQCPKTQNAVPGWGNPLAKLVIVLDCPGDHLAEKLLVWLCQKLSLTADDIWVDYTFKCPIESRLRKELHERYFSTCWNVFPRPEVQNNHTLVLMGNYSISLLAGAKTKDIQGRKAGTGAWCCYSLNYLLMNPAECVTTWRVLYKAAEEAGLKPRMDMKLGMFKFPSKKLR